MRFALRSPPFAVVVHVVCLFLNVLLLPTVVVGQSRLPPCPNAIPVPYWDSCQGTERTFTIPDGVYVGEFKDGKKNGQGTVTYDDGSKYVGEFKDGKRNGWGTYTYTDGSKLVGEFKTEK